MLKVKAENARLSRELSAGRPAEFSPEIKELIRSGKVRIITDSNTFREWSYQNIRGIAKQEAINTAGYQAFVNSLTPMLVRSDTTPGHAAIITAPGSVKSPLVVKQFGHYLANTDLKEVRSIAQATFIGGKRTPYYKAEQQAWDRAGVDPNDPVRQLDLNKQKADISALMGIPYGVAASLITRILLNGASK